MSEVVEEHIQYSIEEIAQEEPTQKEPDVNHSPTKLILSEIAQVQEQTQENSIPTQDTEQEEEESDVVVGAIPQAQLMRRHNGRRTVGLVCESSANAESLDSVGQIRSFEGRSERFSELSGVETENVVSNQEQEQKQEQEQEEQEQEEEDLSIIIKEEVIPENTESENLQKLMQLISKETPDVQFEEIYKDVVDPEPVAKKEWTRIKGEDLYSKISSSAKTNAIKLTEPPTPVPNPPNIKLTSNVSTPEKTQQDVPAETSTEKTQQDASSVVVPVNTPNKITPEIVFIVPYRDREKHRKMFADTMKMLLKKSPPYKILNKMLKLK